MRLPRLNNPLPPRQRGVFGLMAAGLMLLMVISVALAVDTGRLFLEQRHMQRVADLAALEAAGAVTLISQASDADLASAAQDSAKRNGHDIGDSEESKRALSAVGGGVCRAPEDDGWARVFFAHALGEGTVECSTLDGSYSGTLERHAVEVTASHQVRPSLFGSLLGEDEITISATAMAQRSQAEEYAVFSVGSRLLSLDTDDSILSPILRGVLDLGVGADLLGFEGLADATVTLADLLDVSELNVGSVEQLLSADLTLLQLVDAVAGAVGEEEVVGLSALANLVALHLPNVELVLGDILGVTTDTIPLMAEINVPELLSTALLVASQGNAVALPGLNLSVPGVANIEAMLEVIEPPQIAIGPVGCIDDADPPCAGNWKTEARTAQLTLGLGANVNIPVLANLGVKLGVTAAGARAGIEDVDPADGGEWHKWDVEVSAEQYPLVSKLDLNLGVLSTSLPLLDPGLDGSGIPLLDEFLGSLGLAGSLLVNLLSAVGNLLGAVVGTLVTILEGILGLLASTNEYYKASTDEVCVEATALLGIIKRTRCEPAPKLTDDIGTGDQTIGWEPSLQDWISSFEAHASSSSMTPSSQRLEWPGQREASFTGSTEVALELGSLLSGIDLELQLFGANIPADGLLSPVLAVVQAVADEIVGSLAAGVIDPLLDELGVNISEAEVRVIHIDHRTGPPELL